MVEIIHIARYDEIPSQKHEVVGARKLFYDYFHAKGIYLNDQVYYTNTHHLKDKHQKQQTRMINGTPQRESSMV